MHLLALNLHRQSAINVAIYGNFTGPKNQEFVVAKGNFIELLRPDDTGKMISICSTPTFSVVRSLLAFRLAGANKDYVVIGSDSGKISVVEFDVQINDWKVVHCEVFGKTGCRRIVPGQYLAADPKGRAIMIAGIEKQKFVYVMNRDSANRLTISSPLEAHKADTILFSMCGVDVGFDNPIFAMIELEYTEADQDPSGEAAQEAEKKLTYYELDLGLNHVVRKWSEPISRTANLLLTVPGGDDGPSGVLICGENWVSYKRQGHVEVRTAIPRRAGLPIERGVLITTGTMHKQKDLYFFMIQSEFGDLYKVTLVVDSTDRKIVQNVVVTVFDTMTQASNSICITKTGLLFAANEFGNHGLFQFQGIGDDLTAVKSERILDEETNEELGDDSVSASRVAPTFVPATKMKNLLLTDNISSLAAITDMLIEDLAGEESPQIHTLCGRGNKSTLRVLRHGVSVSEMAVSELPGRPTAVWTVRSSHDSDHDRFIIVSFSNATLVLSIGETVEEVTDSGFLATSPTLQVVLLGDNALLQVHPNGIRHIRPDRRITEWKTPGRRQIELASANARQVVVSLQGGCIIYFEQDVTGQLLEAGTLDLGKEVASLDLGAIPEGRAKSSFLAVGLWDDSVQVLSLESNDRLTHRSAMSLPARPDSVCLVYMAKEKGVSNEAGAAGGAPSAAHAAAAIPVLFLNIGLANGVIVRTAVDAVTGAMSDARQRFLGPKSIKLFRVVVRGQAAVLALSSRPWLFYNYQGKYHQSPLSYQALEYASNFASEVCPEGIVAVAGNTLRIVTVENLGEMFNQVSHPLRYTPKKMCRIPGTGDLVIIETDQHEYNEAEKALLACNNNDISEDMAVDSAIGNHNGHVGGESEEEEEEEDVERTFVVPRGPLPPSEGKWASCIRIMDPTSGMSKDVLELTDNEAAVSTCTCRFSQHSEETFVIVGTAKNMTLHPLKYAAAYIHVYRLLEGRLQLLHQTEVEEVPFCMTEFQGKLLVGLGRSIRLMEMGKRKLLRKCENKLFPTLVARLQVNGDRIYVGDLTESIHFVRYKRQENALVIFADDTCPRFTTALTVVDYDTVAGSDKFGNVFVLRLPDNTSDDVDAPSSTRVLWDHSQSSGAPSKANLINHYYLGETVTAMTKCTLVPGGRELLVVSTITGALYGFVPFQSKEDITFFQHLEMFLRQECPNLCQRDHLSYRSYYQPVKDCVDGDLCDRYDSMPLAKQKEFSEDVDRTHAEIMKKLEDSRNIL